MEEPMRELQEILENSPDHKAAHAELVDRTSVLDETAVCVVCNVVIYYAVGEYAEAPGHVYSPEGAAEVRIAGWCEYCFDDMFGGLDEPADEDWGPF